MKFAENTIACLVTCRTFRTKLNLYFSNLDWLYNKDIVFTSVSSESDDENDDYQYHIDDQYYSNETDNLNKLKQFLEEISFTELCESILSYTSLKNRSKYNFRHQVKNSFLLFTKFFSTK